MKIAVCSAGLPSRLDLLAELCASVHAQTFQPYCHIISLDYEGVGASRNGLRASWAVPDECEWMLLMSDDNLIDPDYLERMLPHLADADIAYPKGRVTRKGEPVGVINEPFDAEKMLEGNHIDGNCMYRVAFWRDLGGHDPVVKNEDWDFWLRAMDAGARFRFVDEELWTYRFAVRDGHYNLSLNNFSA